jgi:phospholipase/carboxylesterase
VEITAGVKPELIIIGGFSQGAAMATFASFTLPIKVGRFVCLSGYLPHAPKIDTFDTKMNAETKVLVIDVDFSGTRH